MDNMQHTLCISSVSTAKLVVMLMAVNMAGVWHWVWAWQWKVTVELDQEGQWKWQQVCNKAVGIVVVVEVVAVLGCVVVWAKVFRITKHLKKQVYKKTYCAMLPTVCYQTNIDTSTQHARTFAHTFYRVS